MQKDINRLDEEVSPFSEKTTVKRATSSRIIDFIGSYRKNYARNFYDLITAAGSLVISYTAAPVIFSLDVLIFVGVSISLL